MVTGYYKKTLKTKLFLRLYRHYPRLDQWFLKQCDMQPCGTCKHWDDYGCTWVYWVDPECKYEPRTLEENHD